MGRLRRRPLKYMGNTQCSAIVCCWVAQLCLILLQPHGLQPTRLLHPWDFPGRSTGVGCHHLLIPWTVAYQAPLSMGFLRQKYWSRLLFPSPGDLPNPGIRLMSPALGKEMAINSGVLAWRIPGTGEPGGLPSMGSHRVGHDWSDSAAAIKQ